MLKLFNIQSLGIEVIKKTMLKRLLLVSVLLTLLTIGLSPTRAQEVDNNWTAWIYRHQIGTVTVIDPNGAILDDFVLPIGPAFLLYSRNIVVSPSGRFIAYMVSDTAETNPNQQLIIYDLSSGITIAQHNTPSTAGWTSFSHPDSAGFIESQSLFAFSYELVDFTSGEPPSWEMITLDYNSGVVTNIINQRNPIAEITVNEFSVLPLIRQSSADGVTFVTLVSDNGGQNAPAYTWDFNAGTINLTDYHQSGNSDLLRTTGDVIQSSLDDGLGIAPTQDGIAPYGGNIIQVYSPANAGIFPFYHTEARFIIDTDFVEFGNRVLSTEIDPSGIVAPQWVLLERDGTTVAQTTAVAQPSQIKFTADGFVVFNYNEGLRLTHIHTNNNGFEQRPIWSDLTSGIGGGQLAYVQNFAFAPPSYADWVAISGG